VKQGWKSREVSRLARGAKRHSESEDIEKLGPRQGGADIAEAKVRGSSRRKKGEAKENMGVPTTKHEGHLLLWDIEKIIEPRGEKNKQNFRVDGWPTRFDASG